MTQRLQLLSKIAKEIVKLVSDRVVFIGIDGVDGAGKTVFADKLAGCFESLPVIRSSVDGFHNPREIRYLKGKNSPEGFFYDSYNYEQLKTLLLEPLKSCPPKEYQTSYFDHRTNQEVKSSWMAALTPSILIFDGIFLHRPEIREYWDYSIFLDVTRQETLKRCNIRAGVPEISSDPSNPIHQRYVLGQDLYLHLCKPRSRATRIINNQDFNAPNVVS